MKAACALAVVALAVGPPAAGAVDVSGPGTPAFGAQAGIGAQGATTLAWSIPDTYQVAARPLGSLSFDAPADVMPTLPNATQARFAFGAGGEMAAAFDVGSGILHAVKAALRRPGAARFEPPLTVSASTNDQTLPQAVVAPDGNVTVVWQERTTAGLVVRGALLNPAAPGFDAAVNVSPAAIADDLNPRVAVDAAGTVTVVWERFNGVRTVVEGARRAAGAGTFTPPVPLSSASGSAKHPVVAVSPQGDATVAWITLDADGSTAEAATWPAGASAPVDRQTLSDPADQASDAAVAVNAQGDATVAWSRAVLDSSGGINIFREDNIQAASRAAQAIVFGSAHPVSPAGTGAQLPQVVVGPTGTATITWRGAVDANYLAQAASRAAGEPAFSTPQILSATGANASGPALAIDPVGDVTVAWVRDGRVQAEVLDTGGPVLDGLSVPDSASAGVPFSVGVSPRDERSGLGETTWRFGDGGSAAGTTASHTYAAPGTYLVTVTSADSHGITTSAKRRVTVSAVKDTTEIGRAHV